MTNSPTLDRRTLLRGPARPPAQTAPPPLEVIALNRMAFGPRPGELAAFRALASSPEARLAAYVEQQLDPAAIDDSECEARIAASGYASTLNKSLAELWAEHVVANNDRMAPVRETERVTMLRAVYSRRQLQEVLADFWHNHFNVYGWDVWVGPVFVHYDRDVIRAHMLGNFRQMLDAVAKSTAMLYYLDNRSNSGGRPNENFARELFELHALGAEHYLGVRPQSSVPTLSDGRPSGYVDEDVYGATTCFTGWTTDTSTGAFLYRDEDHYPYQKLVLGQLIPPNQGPLKDGHDVLDMVAAHPGTARHVVRKLCRRLISDSPPDALVEEIAALFLAQQGAADQLKQVTQAILLSDTFRSTWGQKIKRPFELAASALRATQAEFSPGSEFVSWFSNMGQGLFQWRAPNGYSDVKEDWISSSQLLYRWRLVNRLIEGFRNYSDPDIEYDVYTDLLAQTPATMRSPSALADFWIARILGRPMEAGHQQEIVDLLAQGRNPAMDLTDEQRAERLPRAVGLILLSPDFQRR